MAVLGWLDSREVRRSDLGIAAAFLIASLAQIWTIGSYDARLAVSLGALAAALAIALRRRAPMSSAVVVAAYFVGIFIAGFGANHDNPSFPGAAMLLDPGVTLLPAATVLFVTYSVAAHTELRRAVAALAILFCLFTALTIGEQVAFAELLVLLGGISCAWLLGRRIRRRRLAASVLAARAAALELNRGERDKLAIAAERQRIARELHDIVANRLGIIVVQASAELRVLPPEADSTRQALATIEETGRQALAELRRLLSILREDDEDAELVSPPSMQNIEELVQRMRDAGLPTRLELIGDPSGLPPGIDLSAYRIVQEALTNTLKHAGDAQAIVSIRCGERQLELAITDDGRGTGNGGDPGHGLVGMQERAALFGGDLEAGPCAEGGFAVRARFPLESAG
jgi:signal transduction histidine kinase